MRLLAKNKQKLKYSLQDGTWKVHDYDADGLPIIDYVDEEGNTYPPPHEEIKWTEPAEFLANIAMSGGEAEAMAYGLSVSDFDASIVMAKDAWHPERNVDLPIGSLIWHNSEVLYRDVDKTVLNDKSADYKVLRALESINLTRYLLKAVVK